MTENPPTSPPVEMHPSARRLEATAGHWVQRATYVLALLVALGLSIFLFHHGAEPAIDEHNTVFHGEPQDFRSLRDVPGNLDTTPGRGAGMLAVILLLLMPLVRVALCVEIFRRDGRRIQVLFSLAVLAVLLFSLLFER